jgi:hypothetical protein
MASQNLMDIPVPLSAAESRPTVPQAERLGQKAGEGREVNAAGWLHVGR